MLKEAWSNFKIIRKKKAIEPVFDFLLFAFILLSMHYLFRYWANELRYSFFGFDANPGAISDFLISQLVPQSSWVARNIFQVDHYVQDNVLRIPPNAYVAVTEGCSGLKPMYQVIGLFLFFRGPYVHKLWFIPFSLFVVHMTNIFRISGLAWVAVHFPERWDWLHDWFFRPLFYVNVFLLWLWWVEVFARTKSK